MTRLDALKAAQAYVDGLFEEKKPNGYLKFEHVSIESRIAQTLTVARFLYEEGDDD